MRHALLALSMLLAIGTVAVSEPQPRIGDAQRTLKFEDRVKAQEAIERVYYSHQIGATRPFEEAVPREILERKVRTYLKQTAALEKLWATPVTSESLQREIERMARGTRMPERLIELYAALGNDPALILECLARPALVDRLTRNFFASDERIHGEARKEAEALRRQIVSGEIDPAAQDPRRSVSEVTRDSGERSDAPSKQEALDGSRPDGIIHQSLSPEQFDRWTGKLPPNPGEVGAVEQERDGFLVRIVRERETDRVRAVSYRIEKRSWDGWWTGIEPGLAESQVAGVVSGEDRKLALAQPPAGLRSGGDTAQQFACEPNDTWTPTSTTNAPSARAYHTAVWTGSLMVVWGGMDGDYSFFNTGGRYDPATDTWTPTSTANAPSARRAHTAVWTGSLMVVWGGADPEVGLYVNTGGRYDPITDTWTPTSTANAPSARAFQTAVWAGNLMVVWGGYDETGNYFDTGGRYDPANDTWTPTSTANAPSARAYHTAVWTGSLMVIWGGDNYDGTGGRYDPATDTWTPTSTANAPSGRSGLTTVWTGSLMVVWGGGGDLPYPNTGGRYDPATDNWTPTSTANAPEGRGGHTAVWTGSLMVVWGGWGGAGLNTGGRYDPATDTWTVTSTANAPAARWVHTAVWTGSLMVVWGGYDGGAFLNTGGRYNPAPDIWTPTSTANAPEGRSYHTAVWTGSLMVVWGGANYGDTNSGGRYDPATDTWTPTSTANAPEGRQFHTAVWTGSLMVVFGGVGTGTTYLNTGGRYDPVTDTWTPTSTANAPEGRYYHAAVWTGSLMVVWGGFDAGVALDTGGRYNPAADTWMPTSTANAPSARFLHTAVWTGSLMVVWGGQIWGPPVPYTNTGGRYDPTTDTWTATSIANAPSGREQHTAVWTGSLMVIWGGESVFFLDTGGLYDPATDTWTLTSTADAPSERVYHTAVWTGTRMVVWGGTYGPNTRNTGGLYDPATDTWTPTSIASVPSERFYHTAVWTGSLMVVWGGSPSAFNTGGRYSLALDLLDADGDGFSECAGDCDDTNPTVYPGAPESCNGLDDDCDGTVDNGGGALCDDGNVCTDDACDGVARCGHTNNSNPCDDGDACTTGDACNGGSCLGTAGSIPGDVSSVSASKDGATAAFSWDATAGATAYDMLRGRMQDWPVGSNPATETCFADDVAATTASDGTVPTTGEGYWYLVRADNACGSGSYGWQESQGVPTVPRLSGTCP